MNDIEDDKKMSRILDIKIILLGTQNVLTKKRYKENSKSLKNF